LPLLGFAETELGRQPCELLFRAFVMVLPCFGAVQEGWFVSVVDWAKARQGRNARVIIRGNFMVIGGWLKMKICRDNIRANGVFTPYPKN